MAQAANASTGRVGFARTDRADPWWLSPSAVFAGLTAFVVYATWAAFQGTHYWWGSYLSPFYSPVLVTDVSMVGHAPAEHAWFGLWPSWWPRFLPTSPALLILVFPGLFRFTCYYYRKAYYRAFAGTPPGCAVSALPHQEYRGETGWLIFQNLHRYALYPAIVYIIILYYDAFTAFFYEGEFGVGVGSVVLLTNATLLAGYTFGCHSFRHLVGGRLDCYSCTAAARFRHGVWSRASMLNARHMIWAWASLIWVAFSDFYVRMVSMGVFDDLNTWGI